MRFALKLSPDVIGVHVVLEEDDTKEVQEKWARYVEGPICAAGMPQPRLVILSSPYRRLFKPLLDFIIQQKNEYPLLPNAVIIPELGETHWYEDLLHIQRGIWLKTGLLFWGRQRVVIINVHCYLG